MESNLKLKAIVIGATGAVGRELVDCLLNNENYIKVTTLFHIIKNPYLIIN